MIYILVRRYPVRVPTRFKSNNTSIPVRHGTFKIPEIHDLMMSHIKNHNHDDAIHVFEQFNTEGVVPHDASVALYLKALAKNGEYHKGVSFIDSYSTKHDSDTIDYMNGLITFYGVSGHIDKALDIFNTISHDKSNIESSNSIIKYCVYNHRNADGIHLFEHSLSNTKVNDMTRSFYLKALINTNHLHKAKEFIHSNIYLPHLQPLCHDNITLITSIIDVYNHSKHVHLAEKTFEHFNFAPSDFDIGAISCVIAMMKCYLNNKKHANAIQIFEQFNAFCPHDTTSLLYLKSVTKHGELQKGKRFIDANITQPTEHSSKLINGLIDFYGECGDINKAINLFEQIKDDPKTVNIVSIGSIMTCLIRNDEQKKAMKIYEQFEDHPFIKHNDITHTLYLSACSNIGDYDNGKHLIDSKLMRMDLSTIKLVNKVIDFYAEAGDVDRAENVFQDLQKQKRSNVVSVCSMMKCYIYGDQHSDAIQLYQQYTATNDPKNDILYFLYMKACLHIGDYDNINSLLESKLNMMDMDKHSVEVIGLLMEYYAKTGDIEKSKYFFRTHKQSNHIHCVGAMMKCYIYNHQYEEAMTLVDNNHLFAQLLDTMVKCGNSEHIHSVWKDAMNVNIVPDFECYCSAINAAYRGNDELFVDSLVTELKRMKMNDAFEFKKCCKMYHHILRAYGNLGNVEKMWIEYNEFKGAVHGKPDLVSLNILTTYEQRKEHQILALDEVVQYVKDWKQISHKDIIHFYRMSVKAEHAALQSILAPFMQSNSQRYTQVYSCFNYKAKQYVMDNQFGDNKYIKRLVRKLSYKMDTSQHPQYSTRYAKKMLLHHSEKKALAFLIHHNVEDITITTSLKMCLDCHRFFQRVSKHYPNIKITLFDGTVTHNFNKGSCGCGTVRYSKHRHKSHHNS
eukprot:196053_1